MGLLDDINKLRKEVNELETAIEGYRETTENLNKVISHIEGVESGLGLDENSSLSLLLEDESGDTVIDVTIFPSIYKIAVIDTLRQIHDDVEKFNKRLKSIEQVVVGIK